MIAGDTDIDLNVFSDRVPFPEKKKKKIRNEFIKKREG